MEVGRGARALEAQRLAPQRPRPANQLRHATCGRRPPAEQARATSVVAAPVGAGHLRVASRRSSPPARRSGRRPRRRRRGRQSHRGAARRRTRPAPRNWATSGRAARRRGRVGGAANENLKGRQFDATGGLRAEAPFRASTRPHVCAARGRSALASHTDATDVAVGAAASYLARARPGATLATFLLNFGWIAGAPARRPSAPLPREALARDGRATVTTSPDERVVAGTSGGACVSAPTAPSPSTPRLHDSLFGGHRCEARRQRLVVVVCIGAQPCLWCRLSLSDD